MECAIALILEQVFNVYPAASLWLYMSDDDDDDDMMSMIVGAP